MEEDEMLPIGRDVVIGMGRLREQERIREQGNA